MKFKKQKSIGIYITIFIFFILLKAKTILLFSNADLIEEIIPSNAHYIFSIKSLNELINYSTNNPYIKNIRKKIKAIPNIDNFLRTDLITNFEKIIYHFSKLTEYKLTKDFLKINTNYLSVAFFNKNKFLVIIKKTGTDIDRILSILQQKKLAKQRNFFNLKYYKIINKETNKFIYATSAGKFYIFSNSQVILKNSLILYSKKNIISSFYKKYKNKIKYFEKKEINSYFFSKSSDEFVFPILKRHSIDINIIPGKERFSFIDNYKPSKLEYKSTKSIININTTANSFIKEIFKKNIFFKKNMDLYNEILDQIFSNTLIDISNISKTNGLPTISIITKKLSRKLVNKIKNYTKDNISVSSFEYKGHIINTIKSKKTSLFHTETKNYTVLSLQKQEIKNILHRISIITNNKIESNFNIQIYFPNFLKALITLASNAYTEKDNKYNVNYINRFIMSLKKIYKISMNLYDYNQGVFGKITINFK